MCREREDLLKVFLDKFEELGIRHIVNLVFEDEDEEDEPETDDECCDEDDDCEGELCGIAFNFDIGNVNINGTITMIEDEEDEEAEAGV